MIKFLKNNIDYFKKFILAFTVIVVYKTFDNLTSIFHSFGLVLEALGPFFAALIVAYMLHLPAIKLSGTLKKIKNDFVFKHSYGIAILAVYILAAVFLAVIIGAVVPAMYRNIVDFTSAMPNYLTRAYDSISHLEIVEKLKIDRNMPGIQDIITSALKIFDADNLGEYVGQVFSVTSGLIDAFIAVIGSIYMLLDKERILSCARRLIYTLFRKERADSVIRHSSRINEIFTKYIYCRLICSVISAIACGIVLSVMRVKYAPVLALFIGAMDMIPYFGAIISYIIGLAITFITGGVWQMIWVSVALFIIHQINGNFIAPKLMGDSLELRPLVIVIVVFAGGKLFGFLGMLLSVPIAAVIRAIAGDFFAEFGNKRMLTGEKIKKKAAETDNREAKT